MKSDRTRTCLASLLGLVFLLTACGPREISDSKMEAIIHDIFITNAYISLYNQGKVDVDSVDIYTPILESYGYDIEDFRYTLDRWALKKSSRLSELIDKATADIQRENQFYIARQRVSDRLDSLLVEIYRDTVYWRPDTVWYRGVKQKDSLKLRFPLEEGSYRLRYGYYVHNEMSYLPMRYTQKNAADRAVDNNTRALNRTEQGGTIDVTFDYRATASYLEVMLADYSDHVKDPAIRIDSLLITHHAPIEKSRRRFLADNMRRYFGEYYPYAYPNPEDSGTLHVVPPFRPDTARHTDL